jgi:hypothetical protein
MLTKKIIKNLVVPSLFKKMSKETVLLVITVCVHFYSFCNLIVFTVKVKRF